MTLLKILGYLRWEATECDRQARDMALPVQADCTNSSVDHRAEQIFAGTAETVFRE